jgi:hypothetical protein
VALRFLIIVERVNVDAIDRLSRGEQILDLSRAPGDAWTDTLSGAPTHLFEQTNSGRVFRRGHQRAPDASSD